LAFAHWVIDVLIRGSTCKYAESVKISA